MHLADAEKTFESAKLRGKKWAGREIGSTHIILNGPWAMKLTKVHIWDTGHLAGTANPRWPPSKTLEISDLTIICLFRCFI